MLGVGARRSRTIRVGALCASLMVLMFVLVPASYPVASGSEAQPTSEPFATGENRALRVTVDGQGRPWAVWEADDGTDIDVYYSRWQGQSWAPPRILSAEPDRLEHSPSLVFTPDGEAAWAGWAESARQ